MSDIADISLDSDAVQVVVGSDLALQLIDSDTPEIVRASPGVRGADLSEIASFLLITSSAGANLTTLILARSHLEEFAKRLFATLRGGRNSVEISTNINGTKASVKISTADSQVELTQTLATMIAAIDAAGASESEGVTDGG